MLKNMKNKIVTLIKEEDGQGMTEYSTIIVLIVVAVIGVIGAIGIKLYNNYTKLNEGLGK